MKKVALITGGSRGIGAATSMRLSKDGYSLAINYVSDSHAADSLVETIILQGGHAIAVQADISVEAEVLALFNAIDVALDGLDLLVNNAGVLATQMPVVSMTAERINRVMATNVTGTFLCCREAIKRMSTNYGGRGGVIINVSSAAARLGSAGEYVDYAASKGAIDTLTTGLAAEVADQGIRVNAVRPGLIYTEMHSKGGEPGRVDRLSQLVPMKRGGQPEEVAAAIAWLASDESSYSTGAFIEVSGGR